MSRTPGETKTETTDAPDPDQRLTVELAAIGDLVAFFKRNYDWWMLLLKKTVIWTVFFGLLYLLRDFFAVVFLTFIFGFIMNSLIHVLSRYVRWPWKVQVTLVFLVFLGLWVGAGFLVVPAAQQEGEKFVSDFPNIRDSLKSQWNTFLAEHPPFATLVTSERKRIDKYVDTFLESELRPALLRILQGTLAMGTYLILSLLFSLLILLDLQRLRREVVKLRESRIATFYEVTGKTVVKFGAVLGKVFEAQAVIAIANTTLTAIGLTALGIPSIFFLSFIVFIGSFIPVLGVWISSVPICLLGLVKGGFPLLLTLVGFITVIHLIEAYILNPRIMGAALHINPVLVLAILFVSAHFAGFWGALLGVPTVFYIFKYVFSHETPEVGLRARRAAARADAAA